MNIIIYIYSINREREPYILQNVGVDNEFEIIPMIFMRILSINKCAKEVGEYMIIDL